MRFSWLIYWHIMSQRREASFQQYYTGDVMYAQRNAEVVRMLAESVISAMA